MAFLLPNLSPSLFHPKSIDKPPSSSVAACSASSSSSPSSSAQMLSSQAQTQKQINSLSPSSLSALTSLQTPTAQGSQLCNSTGSPDKQQRDNFYVNLGLAVRTLREDMPLIFSKDLNYDIYRDDITFVDPLNTFTGIENYKLIFWALRFHGKILFREIALEVYRVWQPSENMILIRWNLKGVPRVPWEAKGEFQGTSRYKLDRNGKIYEHKVDNLAFNFPQPREPAVSVLDLVSACPASPNPTFLWGPVELQTSSWVEFYRAVRETLDREGSLLAQEGLVTCS
ncbi:uncharacterized protein LOC116204869 [Punica granatum]|uniref:Uncharacterized protein LOC116204869 n=2 Tax=Punica granatum TaxID=22663 RepID=A0A6P8D7I1_PUNGR|nr:uncharacterized protein LOC116204869 [Punica granatum]PKI69819.1 hypothetical protein CRG98_009694 [Punica granatum]